MIVTGVPSQLLINRPDILQAENAFVATDYELRSARAAFFPSIVITADAGMNAFRSSLWFRSPESYAYSVIGGLTAPVLNRYQVMAAYRNAYATRNEAFLEYQRAILTGVGEVSTEMNRVLTFQRVSQLKAEEVRTLVTAVDISNDLFLTGYANYIEVLIARQNRLESEIQFTEARKQQFLAAIGLYRALGGGWQ
jgi:outer membrane protein TolC